MTGKGSITKAPDRRLKVMLTAQLIWLLTVFLLGAWWGTLVLKQGSKIKELEQLLGIANSSGHWLKTQRMLFWESSTYYGLLIASTTLLFLLYWRETNRSKSVQAFFASVTHELRTPLTSIRLQAESISDSLQRTQANPSQLVLVQRLLEDTLRLESQVERTLELARVEGGGPVFTQSIRLKTLVDRVLGFWTEAYGPKINVVCEIPALLLIEADTMAVQVILKNCLENATRHSSQERVEVSLKAQVQNSGVLFSISDNGKGFAGNSANLGKIYEKGQDSQGAGVGLYLVKVLMSRMGGRVEFKSDLSKSGQNNKGPGFEVKLWFKQGQDTEEFQESKNFETENG